MPLKYEMLWDNDLEMYQIRALKVFANNDSYIVKEGDLGGWVRGEDNLSHEGNCWIDKDSKLYDNSRVRGNALLRNSSMLKNSIADGNALVIDSILTDSSYITDDVFLFRSHLRDRASVSKEVQLTSCTLSGDAIVYGKFNCMGATITDLTTQEPVVLNGLGAYDVTIMDNHINISCLSRSIDKWRKTTPEDILALPLPRDIADIGETFRVLKPVLESIIESREIVRNSNQF